MAQLFCRPTICQSFVSRVQREMSIFMHPKKEGCPWVSTIDFERSFWAKKNGAMRLEYRWLQRKADCRIGFSAVLAHRNLL
jgi:hypothetical protein